MKFGLFLAIAGVSAVSIRGDPVTPGSNYIGRAKNLEEGLKVVAQQQAFEAKHSATHAAAMAKAAAETLALRNKIRQAREARVTSHDVAPYKTWGSGGGK